MSGVVFPSSLETERLRFERLCRATVDVFECHRRRSRHEPGIEAVTRYLPWDPHETVAETAAYIDDLEAKWREGRRAEYLLYPKDGEDGAGTVAGSAGLIVEWATETAMPAIWLRKPYWGRGYSGERAAALLEVAFERLDLGAVVVPVEDGNERSRRAVERYVERFGGAYEGLIRNSAARPDGRVIDHHRYAITREQYRRVRES